MLLVGGCYHLPWVLLCNDDIDSFLFLYDLMLVCSV